MLAMPKSVSTTRPPFSSSTFPGLTSRCSTPTRCAASSASINLAPIAAASCGSNAPRSTSTSSSEGPSTSSMTMTGRPCSSVTSCTVTTPVCRIRAAACASRCIRVRRSSSSAWEASVKARRTLTATSRFSSSSTARATTPMPPRPIIAVTR